MPNHVPDVRNVGQKSVSRIIGPVHEYTDRRTTWQEAEDLVSRINGKLIGWANYFSLSPVSKAYHVIEEFTKYRLRRWLCKKHKVQSAGWQRYSDEHLHTQLGLIRLCERTKAFAWAKA